MYCLPSFLRYEQISGIGIVLQLIVSRRLQSNELNVEDESRIRRDDATKPTRT